MRSKWWAVLVIIIILVVILGSKRDRLSLIVPNFNQTSKQAEKAPNATPDSPKQYHFNSSTDLKMELESINPQILDSDFE